MLSTAPEVLTPKHATLPTPQFDTSAMPKQLHGIAHNTAHDVLTPKHATLPTPQFDTSAMPKLRLVHGSSGRASDASILSGGALPSPSTPGGALQSPSTPASPLAPWAPRPFDQAGAHGRPNYLHILCPSQAVAHMLPFMQP